MTVCPEHGRAVAVVSGVFRRKMPAFVFSEKNSLIVAKG
jgi:hypothetical protein